jgi:hypothetical protein
MLHSNLVSIFVSYEDIVVLRIQSQELHSQHFIFFIIYKWALHYKRLERLPRDKHFNFLGPFFILQKELMCCENGPKSRLCYAFFVMTLRQWKRSFIKLFCHISIIVVSVCHMHAFSTYLTYFFHH